MKILTLFLSIYLVILGLVSTSYIALTDEYNSEISITKNELSGVDYLQILFKLSDNVANFSGVFESSMQETKLKKQIVENIQTIYTLQEKYPQYKSQELNSKLEKLTKFKMSQEEYFEFLDFIGHENYRIGDISELLFEKDRKLYYLSSLLTHYMPEYLVSLVINHNIIEDIRYKYKENSTLKQTFVEQTKLIYLSSEEISAILDQLKRYKDTKTLSSYIEKIDKNLEVLKKTIDIEMLFTPNEKLQTDYIELTHKILLSSYELNDIYIKMMQQDLRKRQDKLQDKLTYIHTILLLIMIFISVLAFYAYRQYQDKEKKNSELQIAHQETSNALEFKSKFLSNMSHEIRTPLNSVLGLINILAKTELSQKQSEILRKITYSGELLLGVINDILDISKIESGKMSIVKEEFNLEDVILNVQSMFEDKAKEKGVALTVDYTELKHHYFIGDALRVSQILTNLVSNALKFTAEGSVEIIVKNLQNHFVRFEVKDSGIGLKKEQIEHLFEEFVQADMGTTKKYGGTGLGLSISKNLVNMMNGRIHIDSVYGEGSSFIFIIELEITQEKESTKEKELTLNELEEEVNKLENISILVAEDNKMNQNLLTMFLEDTQLNLTFAGDGVIAVNMAKEKSYNLILMDIQMPNMNGYEATKEIRKFDKKTPIVALSANVLQEDVQASLNAGMNSHLAKPIEMKELYITILKWCRPSS